MIISTGIRHPQTQLPHFSWYDSANRRTTLTLPNGVTVAYTYDNDSRVSGIAYTAGGAQLGNVSYSYDADGRPTAMRGSLAAVNPPGTESGNTFNADNKMPASTDRAELRRSDSGSNICLK